MNNSFSGAESCEQSQKVSTGATSFELTHIPTAEGRSPEDEVSDWIQLNRSDCRSAFVDGEVMKNIVQRLTRMLPLSVDMEAFWRTAREELGDNFSTCQKICEEVASGGVLGKTWHQLRVSCEKFVKIAFAKTGLKVAEKTVTCCPSFLRSPKYSFVGWMKES